MKFVKYMLIGMFSCFLGFLGLATAFGNPIGGLVMFLLMPYTWLPAVIINAWLICWMNNE